MKTVFTILVCLGLVSTQAQTVFNKTYPNISAFHQVIDLDTGYLALTSNIAADNSYTLSVGQLTANGDLLPRSQVMTAKYVMSAPRLTSNATGYLVTAVLNDFESNAYDKNKLKLKYYSHSGENLFELSLDSLFSSELKDVQLLSDGSFLVVMGSRINAAKYSFEFLKISETGALLWRQQSDYLVDHRALTLCATADGGFIIGGAKLFYKDTLTNMGLFDKLDAAMIKLDADGNELWRKVFDTNHKSMGHSLIQTRDGNFLFLVRQQQEDKHQVIKLDGEGKELWRSETAQNTGYLASKNLVEATDGTFWVFESDLYYTDEILSTPFCKRFNEDGQFLNEKHYFSEIAFAQHGYGLLATKDRGLLLFGDTFNDSVPYRAWLVKTDCQGCDNQSCLDTLCAPIISLPEGQQLVPELKLYPNPNTGSFTLDLSAFPPEKRVLHIFDAKGREVYESFVADKEIIDLNLERGMYFLEVEGLGWLKKVIIEK